MTFSCLFRGKQLLWKAVISPLADHFYAIHSLKFNFDPTGASDGAPIHFIGVLVLPFLTTYLANRFVPVYFYIKVSRYLILIILMFCPHLYH